MTQPSPFHADPDLFRALAQLAVPIDCPTDRLLFRQGDPCSGLFLLHSGHAQLEMSCIPDEVLARFEADAGSLLGLPAALSGDPYSLSAIAQAGSQVGFVLRSTFLGLIQADPALSFKTLQVLAAHTAAARAALLEALELARIAKKNGNGTAR